MKESIFRNSLYNMMYKGLNVIFPLVTITYVSHILFAEGIGKVAYAQNVVQYFVIMASLGIPNYGIREVAKVRDKQEEKNIIFSELFLINGVSTVLFLMLYLFTIQTVSRFKGEDYLLHLSVGLTLVFNFINVDWFYQGIERYRYIAIRSFFVKFFVLGLTFMLVRKSGDIVKYAILNCLSVGANNICNILFLRKTGVKFRVKNTNMTRHLKTVFVMFASVVSIELYTLLDTTMIGIMCEPQSVGYYSNAVKLVKILITFITALAGVLLPRLSYHHIRGEEEKCSALVSKVFQIMCFLYIPCQIGIFLLAEPIIYILFGDSFAPAGITLKIASCLICSLGFSNLFGTQVLLTYGKEKLLLITTIVGALTNFPLNLFLIPIYGPNGAAIASVISETAVTLVSFYFAKKFVRISLQKRFVFATICSATILVLVVFWIRSFACSALTELGLCVFVGAVTYCLMNMCLKNPIGLEIIEIIKQRANKYF